MEFIHNWLNFICILRKYHNILSTFLPSKMSLFPPVKGISKLSICLLGFIKFHFSRFEKVAATDVKFEFDFWKNDFPVAKNPEQTLTSTLCCARFGHLSSHYFLLGDLSESCPSQAKSCVLPVPRFVAWDSVVVNLCQSVPKQFSWLLLASSAPQQVRRGREPQRLTFALHSSPSGRW